MIFTVVSNHLQHMFFNFMFVSLSYPCRYMCSLSCKKKKKVIKWVSHGIVINEYWYDFQCDFIIWSPSHPKLIFVALLWFWCIASLTYNRHGVLHRWVHAVVLWTAPSSSTQMVPRVFEEHGAWPAMEKRSCPLISTATPVQSHLNISSLSTD